MLKLPVSGAAIALRGPDGADDLLLHEATASAFGGSLVEVGLSLLARLGQGELRDWSELPFADFEFLLLNLRAARFGPHMSLGFACPYCRALAEVAFPIADYLAAAAPRTVAGVTPHPARPGWFSLDGAGFRLPTAGDLIAVAGHAQPGRLLAERCLDETARRKPHRTRVERAMEAMAPELSRPVAGECPSCAQPVQAGLSITHVVISELKRAAGAVHDEIDLIASRYHWPETHILSLPQDRRRAYAERIRRIHAQVA